MRPYGLTEHWMRGCCPGHDKLPRQCYSNRRSKRAHRRDTKLFNRRRRRITKYLINLRGELYGA